MRLLAVSACGLMVAAMMIAVSMNSLNFSPHDEWADSVGVDIAIKVKEGRLALTDLFTPYNGHPLLMWRLVTVLHTALFNYDVRIEQALSILLACLNLVLLGKLTWRGLGRVAPALYWLSIALSCFLLFTPRHTYNYLWGVSLIWIGSVTLVLLGLWTITASKSMLQRLFWLLFLGTVAFFTHGAGVLVWFAWLPTLWLSGERSRRFWSMYGAFTALFLVVRLLLGEGVEARASIPVEGFSISRSFAYFGILLGNVVVMNELVMIGLGIAIVLFVAASHIFLLRLGAAPREVGILASISVFSVTAAATISVARHDIVPLLISSSLYLIHTQLIWIVSIVAGLWLIHLQAQRRLKRQTRYPVLISTSVVASLAVIAFFFHLPLYQVSFQRDFDCAWRYAFSGEIDCTAEFIHNFAQNAVPRLEGMIAHRLGVFNQAPHRAFQVPFNAAWRIPDLPYRFTLHVTADSTCPNRAILNVSAIERADQRIMATASFSESIAQAKLDLSAWRGKNFRLMHSLEAPVECQASLRLKTSITVEALSALQ